MASEAFERPEEVVAEGEEIDEGEESDVYEIEGDDEQHEEDDVSSSDEGGDDVGAGANQGTAGAGGLTALLLGGQGGPSVEEEEEDSEDEYSYEYSESYQAEGVPSAFDEYVQNGGKQHGADDDAEYENDGDDADALGSSSNPIDLASSVASSVAGTKRGAEELSDDDVEKVEEVGEEDVPAAAKKARV